MKRKAWGRGLLLTAAAAVAAGMLLAGAADAPAPEAPQGEPLTGEGFRTVAQDGHLTLSCDPATGCFTVEDALSGRVWYSNPPRAAEDEVAKGSYRPRMLSQLILTVADANGEIDTSCSSYGYSVREHGLAAYHLPQGVRLEYSFPEAGLTVPLQVTLQDGRLLAEIDYTAVRETGESRLLEIAVLPFFGCASPEDEGYWLLPDGSGATVNFHNGKESFGQYRKDVYGDDAYSESQFMVKNGEPIHLPAFGACYRSENRSDGFLAVIESGAADAAVCLDPGGLKSSYTNAYFNFTYREHQKTTALDRTYAEVSYELLATERVPTERVSLSVEFLTENAEYAAMAACLRERLRAAGAREEYRENPVVLDVCNTVTKTGYTLGIPHTKSYSITDFETTASILSTFEGAAAELRLLGWEREGALESTIHTAYRPASSAGGEAGLDALLTQAREQGARVYLNAELSRFQSGRLGYMSFWDSAKSITDKTLRLLPYRRSTLAQDTSAAPSYLLRAEKLLPTAEKLAESWPETADGVALSSLSHAPYSDFRSPYYDKERTAAAMAAALRGTAQTRRVYAQAPDWFAVPYLSVAADLPRDSSRFDLFDASVPFLQLTLRGFMTVSSTSLNLNGDPEYVLLKAIESGSALQFSFVGDYRELSSTSLNTLYGASWSLWRDEAADYFLRRQEALRGLDTQEMIGHTVPADGIAVTTFANGERILVNYTGRAWEFAGQTVAPMSYLRIAGGGTEA